MTRKFSLSSGEEEEEEEEEVDEEIVEVVGTKGEGGRGEIYVQGIWDNWVSKEELR